MEPDNRRLTKTRHAGIYRRGQAKAGEPQRYVVTFHVDGKQRRRTVRGLDNAIAFKASVKADQSRGEFTALSKVNFAEYAEEWVERYQGIRSSSRDNYRLALTRYAIPRLGSKRLTEISPRDLANYVAWLNDPHEQGKDLSANTIAAMVTPLRAMFRTAVEEGLIRHNPSRDLRLPGRTEEAFTDELDGEGDQAKALTREQLSMLLRLIPAKHRLLIEFMAATGLRKSEVNGLQWRHVQLDGASPHILVRRQFYRHRSGPLKTKASKRDVRITIPMADALAKLRRENGGEDSDPVFVGKGGQPIDLENFRRRVLKVATSELDLDCVGFHTLRHTCASLLFDRDANPVQVCKILGHANPGVTLKIYTHFIRAELPEPLDLMAELVERTTSGQHPTSSPAHDPVAELAI